MGNVPVVKEKKRVKFSADIKMDRFAEQTLRYNHILKTFHLDQKDKLALLIIKYLDRCHGSTHVTAENIHEQRLNTVMNIADEAFVGDLSDIQMEALLRCSLESVCLCI